MSDMQTTQQGALEVPPIAALANQLTLADHLVYKKYLPELQDYLLVEPTEEFKKTLDPEKCIKMFHLEALTLKKGEDMLQKALYRIPCQYGAWVWSGSIDRRFR